MRSSPTRCVSSVRRRCASRRPLESVMAEINLVEAVNRALAYEMAHDPSVVLLGEDIGVNGGVFRATIGLQQRFGSQRVIDTPLAETAIAGTAIGMAAMGLKPVVEIQFSGFIYPAIDHVLNHAPEHHSESPEALFTHIPGLRVVTPSSPARAYGLLLAAIRDPDPVIFFEPTRLYRLFRQPVEDSGEALPLDSCFTLRDGSDVTLVSWGGALQDVQAAADLLAQEGVLAEVIDVATLKPLDMNTILAS